MKKMPCLFVREFHGDGTFTITGQVTPGCAWALAGEGRASRKWDGTAVLIQGGKVFARYDAKRGKAPPAGAIPCTEAPDPITGHWPHWVEANRPQDTWIREAHRFTMALGPLPDGTYEAIGPKIQDNPERLSAHLLMLHGEALVSPCPRDFAGLRAFLSRAAIEGIVFHHPDGRMCKIRRDDFGFPWPFQVTQLSPRSGDN